MNCETAESDLPLMQAERTEDCREPQSLLNVNAAYSCALLPRTRIIIEIGPQSGIIQTCPHTESCTAALWYVRISVGSVAFAIRWNIIGSDVIAIVVNSFLVP